ncbi:hypothetical protein [Prochlorococcus marinus]|nr:hypothetical protein [Prochlorococcus marinus]
MQKKIEIYDDSLLGGAAMTIEDLRMVESQEIKWLMVLQNSDQNNFENAA